MSLNFATMSKNQFCIRSGELRTKLALRELLPIFYQSPAGWERTKLELKDHEGIGGSVLIREANLAGAPKTKALVVAWIPEHNNKCTFLFPAG